jgi:2,3-bisphosphoglycerate-dependent phosphoglycerate mutase
MVRHAQAQLTDAQHTDDERPLTDAGRVAAARLTRWLSQRAVTAVYSSPSRRAIETVELIASDHGLSVQVSERLRERQLASQHLVEPAYSEALKRARENPDLALPGGESTNDVLHRALRALSSISHATPVGVAVAGTHGGLISIVRWHLGDEFAVEDALAEPMPAIYLIRWRRGGWTLEPAEYP